MLTISRYIFSFPGGRIAGRTICAVLAMFCLQTAAANDYFVEAVVFAWNDDGNIDAGDGAERWHIAGRDAAAMPSRIRNQSDNPAVASDKRLLDQAISRLVESRNAQLLMHQAWTQSRAGRDGSPQVAFTGAIERTTDLALDGWVRAYESSLLYIEIDLALTDPNAVAQIFLSDSRFLDRPSLNDVRGGRSLPQGSGDPTVENRGGVTVTTDAEGNVSFSNRGGGDGSGENGQVRSTTPGAATRTGLTWRISERRRVKFNEIHYIDHPKFGVLFTISRNDGSS